MNEPANLKAIGFVESPYKEKFAVPRQANLVPSARGKIHFYEHFSRPEYFTGIEQFSHLWLLFRFHLSGTNPRSTVRPPRLGGNQKIGIFASRSPFRVNNLGLSCVKLDQVVQQDHKISLAISGLDLVDATPIYDIKPYLPYTDHQADAFANLAPQAPGAVLEVIFCGSLDKQMIVCEQIYPGYKSFLKQVLSQDPRPAYQRDPERVYGVALVNWNVRFKVIDTRLTVLKIEDLDIARRDKKSTTNK